MWSLVAILLILITNLYYYLTRNFNYWKLRNVPSPKPVLLFGNIKESALRCKAFSMVLQEIYKQYPNEKIVGIYKMTSPCLLIGDLDIIKQIMNKDYDVFDSRGFEFSKDGNRANLFHSDGDTWRPLRQALAPIFTMNKLKNMIYLVEDRVDKFMEIIESRCREQPEQSIDKLFEHYSIAALSSCIFGTDIEQLGDTPDALQRMNDKALKVNYFHELDMMFPGILKVITGTIFPDVAVHIFDVIIINVIKQRNDKTLAKIISRVCLLKFSKFRVEVSEKVREEIEFHPMQIILTPTEEITLNIIPRNL